MKAATNILLPTGKLSASQLMKWENDKNAYFKKYFHGETSDDNPWTVFGSRIADILEALHETGEFPEDATDREVKTLSKLTFLDVAESRLVQDLDGVTCEGVLDTRTDDWSLVVDYKTGNKPWNHERLAESIQLKLYALLVRELTGVNPEMGIDWMQTRHVAGTSLVEFTGHVDKFRIHYTDEALDEFRAWVLVKADEISRHYRAHRGDLDGFDRGVLDEYIQAREALNEAKQNEARAREAWIALLQEQGLERVDYPGASVFYRYARRTWDYPEGIKAREAELKALKEQAERTGDATYIEKEVYTYR